jgi:hypothetical protein
MMAVDEDKFGIKKKQEELLAETRKLPPGPQALEKLADLRGNIDWQIDGYRNTLSILSDTTYQDRKHFLLELIQNADDAKFNDADASLTFVIHDDSIELRYNEQGFDVEDVIAITGAGVSTKLNTKRLSHSFIGEKGIGFKSVFALASSVEIESPPWHFALHKDKCIVPEVLYTDEMKKGEGTKLKVKFNEPEVINQIADVLYGYVSGQVESFLFLQRLASFRVEDRRNNMVTVKSLTLQPPDRSQKELELIAYPEKEKRKYLLYREEVEFPAELVALRWERLGPDTVPLKRQLIVAALVETSGVNTPAGRLFCFLPTNVSLPVPLFLQVDGHTKTDRESLHDPQNNRWNKYLLRKIPEFLLRAILSWRSNPDISYKLPIYIPDNEGNDQLAEVFKELMEFLKSASWVRTFDSGNKAWVNPGEAIMATDYWAAWFVKYPDFRKRAEKLLGKKFVHPEWTAKPEWKAKLNYYGVREIDELQITIILKDAKLPREVLQQDDNFIELYRQILNLPALYEPPAHTREWYTFRKSEEEHAKDIKNRLLLVPIYPFKKGVFDSLQVEGEYARVYWLSGDSLRKTGLEGIFQYRIIDKNYTYEPKLDKEDSPERMKEIGRIKERNDLVRKLLIKLGIKGLSEENVLVLLQLPWLLERGQGETAIDHKRFEILKEIFKAYRAKRTKDDNYIKQLARLAEAYFPSENGALCRLREMVLPEVLRFEPIDRLYAMSGLEVLGLPKKLLKPDGAKKTKKKKLNQGQRQKLREEWRQFLIYCGIRNSPEFYGNSRQYENWWDFENNNEAYFGIWQKEVNERHSSYREVKVTTVDLDSGTKYLLRNISIESEELATELYNKWMNKYNYNSGFRMRNYLPDEFVPDAGEFVVSYFYQKQRTPLLKDSLWGGVERKYVPLKTVNGVITCADAALRITLSKQSKFSRAAKHLPLVLEDAKGETGYHSAYLDSLEVREPQITDVNLLWGKFDENDYPEVLKVALEFLEANISGVGLKIYDKESGNLRPATDFMLGREGAKGVPLIESQYGDLGKDIGKKLSLHEENEVDAYSGLFDKIISAGFNGWNNFSEDLCRLLKHWQDWDAASQRIIANELQSACVKYGLEEPPVVIFNNREMFELFKQAGCRAFILEVSDAEKYGLEQSARSLGLLLPEEAGRLEANGVASLSQQELDKFDRLWQRYTDSLEIGERSKLLALILGAGLGDFRLVGSKIFRADSIVRVLANNSASTLKLPLPYLARQEQRFFAVTGERLEIIIAQILNLCGFITRFKHAKQDIEEAASRIRDEDLLLEKQGLAAQQMYTGRQDTIKSAADSNDSNGPGEIFEDINQSIAENNIDKSDETEIDKKPPQMHGARVADVAAAIRGSLKDDRPAPSLSPDEGGWNIGLDPEQEEEMRKWIGSRIVDSLKAGPVIHEPRLGKNLIKPDMGSYIKNLKIVDPDAVKPKDFLNAEYNGRCQICATELMLINGGKYFEVYHIFESRGNAFWADRPFNILSLCPNCHALAKHGGRDMSNIYSRR